MTKPKLWQQSIISMNKCSNLSVHQSWSQASYSSDSNVSTWRQVCSSYSKNSRCVFLVPSILKLLRIRLANALRSYLIDFGFHLESSKVVLCTHDLSDFVAGLSFVLGFEVGDCGLADFRSTTWSDC